MDKHGAPALENTFFRISVAIENRFYREHIL